VLPPQAANAEDIVVGVNVVNPMRTSVADQNAVFAQLKAAGVHVIRCGITPDAKGIDFAKRAAEQGIKIHLLLSPVYPPNAPSRPYQPTVFPSMWGGYPLSFAGPALSKASFQSILDQLDANNIVLAGMELGNEINWAAFNPEFPLPGEGKILSLSDLSHDPEGQQIAKGFLQYLKILAVLKEVRDHSRLNRTTPIILAGLVSAPDGEKLYNNKKEDMVSLPATIAFLRANGLDSLVDAYGSTAIPRQIIPEIRRPQQEEPPVSPASIWLNAAPWAQPAASHAGSPNGDSGTPTSRARRTIPSGLSLSARCALILRRPQHSGVWQQSFILPGTPIPGPSSPTHSACIAAAR
jgi:hypothetical protein